MWTKIIPVLIVLFPIIICELTAPGIDRTVSHGVKSVGFNIVYGDEDMQVINEVVSNEEKIDALKSKINLNEALPPLPYEDVKCLMSVDRYCSKSMRAIKNVLIDALKDDCANCSANEKQSAGKVVASMMAHDPVAWKLFLTRSALIILPKKEPPKEEKHKYKIIGSPEYIENKRNRYTMPGVKVRVKRYAVEKIN